MNIRLFYHSLVSDWNHGNAHFLRGIASELVRQGHEVIVFEPRDAWSRKNLEEEHGKAPIRAFRAAYPTLTSKTYDPAQPDLDYALEGADLVIVHEWNDPVLVQKISRHRFRRHFVLLFHDTHHRLVTQRAAMKLYDLSGYDGVLAYGNVLRDLYLREHLTKRAWTWHEAADTTVFHPIKDQPNEGDLVWIGNWGDDERVEELHEFLIEPVKRLGLTAVIHGVRYPRDAIVALEKAGIEYRGWLPNFRAPQVFARYSVTVHVSRRPYVDALPGIPTIRPFEALASGIPLVSSPWKDTEGLFRIGRDFLMARSGEEMTKKLRSLLENESQRRELAKAGLQTILKRHTCRHRADELLAICELVRAESPKRKLSRASSRPSDSLIETPLVPQTS